MKVILYIFLVLSLIGCMPVPNFHKVQSKISGVVYSNSSPVIGAKIKRCIEFHGNNCSSWVEVDSDTNDRFQLPAKRKFRWLVYLLGDELFRYKISIRYEGKEYDGLEWGDIGSVKNLHEIT